MSDRQNRIYSEPSPRETRPIDGLLGSGEQKSPFWRYMAYAVSGITTLLSLGFFLWVNFGHLVLQPRLTYPYVFGTRQGQTTGEAERASASGRADAQNTINRETARSEGAKQAIVLQETTVAKAQQEARVRATSISETASLEATATCIRQIRTDAAVRRAQCIGSGVAGGECQARGDLIEELEAQCGSLALPDATQKQGVQR